MKIFSVEQTRVLDKFTVDYEPIASIDLMERASKTCFHWIVNTFPKQEHFSIFAGPGNNGGDGLAIARMLVQEGYSVDIYVLAFDKQLSTDCNINLNRLYHLTIPVYIINDPTNELQLNPSSVSIDAIFGSGLSRKINDPYRSYIEQIQLNSRIIISIDIPSGLYSDQCTPKENPCIQADYTLTFEYPKLSFLFPENAERVGVWEVLSIGLSSDKKQLLHTNYFYLTNSIIRAIVKGRSKFSHKGNFGRALIVAGSHGKIGAAILAAKACLRSGIGLLSLHVPVCGCDIIQTAVPEAMVELNVADYFLKGSLKINNRIVGVGPGIGQHVETHEFLLALIKQLSTPAVFDADAINILSKHKEWLDEVPAGSIFTPHPKEFKRLVGEYTNDMAKLNLQRSFSRKFNCYVVLKGAHTSISTPEGIIYFNSTGNPGMATAGSGDVLTGIITALLAQGYKSEDACKIGVFIHGLAGDLAADTYSQEALIATDIIDHLGTAWKRIH